MTREERSEGHSACSVVMQVSYECVCVIGIMCVMNGVDGVGVLCVLCVVLCQMCCVLM